MGLLLTLVAFGRESQQWERSEYLPGRLIVSFAPQVQIPHSYADNRILTSNVASVTALFDEFEVTTARRLVPNGILSRLRVAPDFYHTYVVEFHGGQSVLNAVDRFAADAFIQSVEPDLLCRTFRNPNDALWSSQWDKRIVRANQVWDVSTGSRSIICAGIDTGVDWNHPDLVPALWVNPGEDTNQDGVAWTWNQYPGDMNDVDGEDNDGDGYVDDMLGWDFIANINGCATTDDCDDQQDNNMMGVNSHGTHVAGLMCATGNNSVGVAGMSWVGSLMALRAGYQASDGNGYIPESASIPATLFAAAHGAKIINMSYGGSGSSGSVAASIASAWAQGALIFAASGNDGSTTPQYPANYDSVIAVNATNNADRLASWSNRGSWTELCAPGGSPGITSTIINSYGQMEGTSMASPNAAGVAALVWSLVPNMTNEQLRALLLNTAINISSLNPGIPASHLGHGRIDALAAVTSVCPRMEVTGYSLSDSSGGNGNGRLEVGESMRLILNLTNTTGWAAGDSISVNVTVSDSQVTVTNPEWYLGTIARGATANNSDNPFIMSAASVSGVDSAYLHVTFSSPNGYQHSSTDIPLLVGSESSVPDPDRANLPVTTALCGNYPNPFNPSTTIRFDLADPAAVRLSVYDITGRAVATLVDQAMIAGAHSVAFDGASFPSGVYLVRLQAGSVSATSKMMLVK
jgi:subtilisin family serine protease